MTKVLLDTDIGYGTDADDALALAYLLLHPDCELLGVTTVGRRSGWRAGQADLMIAEMGGDVPVVAGADEPLWENFYWAINPIKSWPAEHPIQPRATFDAGKGVRFFSETIRKHPKEITLVTIGQFTNLALLLLTDPEAIGMLARIISMGGRMGYPADVPKPECNVMLDPIAAGICFQRLGAELTLLPIDPVRDRGLKGERVDRILAGGNRTALYAFCRGWHEHKGKAGVGLADPMAVAMAMQPDLVTTVNARAGVRLAHKKLPSDEPFPRDEVTGVTYLAEEGTGPHYVVTGIDTDRTHAHLMEIYCGE
jgi:purine nucleosidase